MTQIDAVTLEGLCGLHERVELPTVGVFHGPNGSGKSTIVGAIAYALTGRFPGVVGITSDALLALAPAPQGFLVTVEAHSSAGSICVIRGVQKGKRHLSVTVDTRTTRNVSDATALIRKHFGDVEWFADSFDPERSFWRMSPEKRSRWMFELCASASGWTKERVLVQLGVSPTTQIIERARLSMAGHDVGFDELAFVADFQRKSAWNPHLGRDAASNVEINLQQLEERLLATQRVVREATSIADGIAAPTFAPTDAELQQAEHDVRTATEEGERARAAKATWNTVMDQRATEIAALDTEVLVAGITVAATPSHCPTCHQPLAPEQAARITHDSVDELQVLLGRLEALQLIHAAGAADESALVARLDAAVARYATACQSLATLRQQEGLAKERTGQLAAAEGAAERIDALKKLLEAARVVRRAMVQDSIQPLRNALAKLGRLTPRTRDGSTPPRAWEWWVGTDGSFQMVLVERAGNEVRTLRTITVEAMSAGEKYRATIALLVATSMLRREPWAGLFLDAFEQVSDDVRRDVLGALVNIHKAGHVDNVFVAGAFGPGAPVEGVTYSARTRP